MTDAAVLTCPTCSSPLDPVVHEGVELDRCPAGCGVWLDRGELRTVVASELAKHSTEAEQAALAAGARDAGHAVVAELASERRACPRCGTAMRLEEYARSGIAIDECAAHGVWLDDGELERIEAYAEGFRRQATPLAATTGGIRGIDIPQDVLATISSVRVPPPASAGD